MSDDVEFTKLLLDDGNRIEVLVNEEHAYATILYFGPWHNTAIYLNDEQRRRLIDMLWHPDDFDKEDAEIDAALTAMWEKQKGKGIRLHAMPVEEGDE